ncbi:MAG TPA: hypothetical protein VKE26_15200 [Xanthobacteraceae bacterium]|nr:hypothetical protein [Xanthobacteraceae bacterium]
MRWLRNARLWRAPTSPRRRTSPCTAGPLRTPACSASQREGKKLFNKNQGSVAALTAGAVAIALSVISPAPDAAAAQSFTVSGPVRVVDGDTLVVDGVSVRLKGVDAMERGTAEGDSATATMRALVHEGESVTCSVTGEKTHRREVGYCVRDHDGLDLNRAIIAAGAALGCPRYDPRYVEAETAEARVRLRQARYCAPR